MRWTRISSSQICHQEKRKINKVRIHPHDIMLKITSKGNMDVIEVSFPFLFHEVDFSWHQRGYDSSYSL